MKKYWQLLVITVIIVATISGHYIHVAKASKQYYDFSFETISGDNKYLDPLVIEAGYENGHEYSSVVISKDETTLVGSSLNQQTPLLFQQLIDEHKSFMRGKGFNGNSYYENEQQLIYIEEPKDVWKLENGDSYTYNIDILNKKDNSLASISVQAELGKPVNWISISNTAMVGNQLKLIVNQIQNNGSEELHLVVIDLEKQLLVSDTVLESVTSNEATRASIQLYNDYANFEQESNFVYSIVTFNTNDEEYKLLSKQYRVLNIETNEVTEIDIPIVVTSEMATGVVNNGHFVLSNIEDNDLVLYRYHIAQQKWLEPLFFPFPSKLEEKDVYNNQAINGKLYAMNKLDQGFFLQIFDIEEGKTLYRGITPVKDKKQNYNLFVSHYYEMKE